MSGVGGMGHGGSDRPKNCRVFKLPDSSKGQFSAEAGHINVQKDKNLMGRHDTEDRLQERFEERVFFLCGERCDPFSESSSDF